MSETDTFSISNAKCIEDMRRGCIIDVGGGWLSRVFFADMIHSIPIEKRRNIAEFSFKAAPSVVKAYKDYLNQWQGRIAEPADCKLKAYGVLVVEDATLPAGTLTLVSPEGVQMAKMINIQIEVSN